MKTLLIAILAAQVATASAQTYTAPIGPQKPVRAMATPPPLLQRPEVTGVVPQAVRGGDPFQSLIPGAAAKCSTWGAHTACYQNISGKWKGINHFQIIFCEMRNLKIRHTSWI